MFRQTEKERKRTCGKCIYYFAYFLFDIDEIPGIRRTRNDRFFEKPVTYRGYMRSVPIAKRDVAIKADLPRLIFAHFGRTRSSMRFFFRLSPVAI